MTGMKRSLKYWGYMIEKYFLMVLLVIAVYGVFYYFMNGESAMGAVAEYIPMMFCIMILALAYNNMTVSMSQAISMGATRREAFIGMQVFYHLLVVQGIVISGMIMKCVPDFYEHKKSELFMFLTVIYLLACGLGNAIGVVMMRFGLNTAKIIYIFILVVLGLGLVFTTLILDHVIAASMIRMISLCGILLAVILDMLMVRFFSKSVKEYEVRV